MGEASMKPLYILGALMLIGVLLIGISSFKLFSKYDSFHGAKLNKYEAQALKVQLQPYVIAGYLGMTLFVVGGAGSVVALLLTVNRRF